MLRQKYKFLRYFFYICAMKVICIILGSLSLGLGIAGIGFSMVLQALTLTPLGITQYGNTGWIGIPGVFTAMLIATPIAVILGWGYGLLLNKVKGEEMMIATYVGFSSVAFMCIMWLVLPYSSSNMVWGYAGVGLRTTVSVEEFWQKAISDIVSAGNFIEIMMYPAEAE